MMALFSLLAASASHSVLPPAAPVPAATHGNDLPSFSEVLHWSTHMTHAAITAGIAIGVGLALHFAAFALLQRMGRRGDRDVQSLAANRLQESTRWAVIITALGIADNFDPIVAALWSPIAQFAVPAIMGWVIYALMRICADLLAHRADGYADQMSARSRRTRIAVLSQTAGFIIIFLTVSLMLLSIPAVRHVGATLMASAGLIGLAVGAAAQPMLKSLIAGMQIVLTEPIRIGDYVVIDGESGRVEDIRLSYVVIRTGDERRFIAPTTKFLDNSFQNWTRVGGITGSVLLPIHSGIEIAPIRAAYLRLLAEHKDWDKRSSDLQVSEVRIDSVELKLVMSAADPTDLAKLRQDMREAMLEWLRNEAPNALLAAAS